MFEGEFLKSFICAKMGCGHVKTERSNFLFLTFQVENDEKVNVDSMFEKHVKRIF